MTPHALKWPLQVIEYKCLFEEYRVKPSWLRLTSDRDHGVSVVERLRQQPLWQAFDFGQLRLRRLSCGFDFGQLGFQAGGDLALFVKWQVGYLKCFEEIGDQGCCPGLLRLENRRGFPPRAYRGTDV